MAFSLTLRSALRVSTNCIDGDRCRATHPTPPMSRLLSFATASALNTRGTMQANKQKELRAKHAQHRTLGMGDGVICVVLHP